MEMDKESGKTFSSQSLTQIISICNRPRNFLFVFAQPVVVSSSSLFFHLDVKLCPRFSFSLPFTKMQLRSSSWCAAAWQLCLICINSFILSVAATVAAALPATAISLRIESAVLCVCLLVQRTKSALSQHTSKSSGTPWRKHHLKCATVLSLSSLSLLCVFFSFSLELDSVLVVHDHVCRYLLPSLCARCNPALWCRLQSGAACVSIAQKSDASANENDRRSKKKKINRS